MSTTSSASPRLHFGFSYAPHGHHPGGWRLQGRAHDPFDPEHLTEVARLAEAARFDFLRFSDRLTPEAEAAADDPERLARTEAFTTASFLATRTRHLGILASGNTSYAEPFNLARLTASLDHVTHGRAGWVVTTGADHPAGRNYSQGEGDPAAHYARAFEVVSILRQLWDSWEDDAFLRNKETGEYVDGSKVHAIHHSGALFRIKGPLNVARPPQGQLVVAHEVRGELSLDMAASEADVVFLRGAEADAVRAAAVAKGRDAERLRLFSEAVVVIGEDDAEAEALLDRLNSAAGRTGEGHYIVGGPAKVADGLEALARTDGTDGIDIRFAFLPDQLALYAESVAPELTRRGLLREAYEGRSLREHLGLERPLNRYAAA